MSAQRVSALDPHHPLVRGIMRIIQAIRKAPAIVGPKGSGAGRQNRLVWAGEILTAVGSHIAKARPSVEYDEDGQTLLNVNGKVIGRKVRPAGMLLPLLERAIERHMCGDDGRDGDVDQVAESEPALVPAAPPASRGTSEWVGPTFTNTKGPRDVRVVIIDRKCAAANDCERAP